MSVTVVSIPGGRQIRHTIQKLVSRYDSCLNSGREYVKNSSTLVVSVLMNFSIKPYFVSVRGPRETYLVDALHTRNYIKNVLCNSLKTEGLKEGFSLCARPKD